MDTKSLRWRSRAPAGLTKQQQSPLIFDSDDEELGLQPQEKQQDDDQDSLFRSPLSDFSSPNFSPQPATITTTTMENNTSSITKNQDHNPNDDDMIDEIVPPTRFQLLSGIALVSSVLSIQLIQNSSIVTKVSAHLTALFGPYVSYQKYRLLLLGGIRQELNHTRQHANELKVENALLSRHLIQMGMKISRLEHVENELQRHCKDRATSLGHLQSILKRQDEVHRRIRACLQRQIVSDIFTVVVTCDRNSDFAISAQELEQMIWRMKQLATAHEGILIFHEVNFRHAMALGDRSLSVIMQLIRRLMADEDDDNDIFTICPRNQTTKTSNTKRMSSLFS